MSNKNKDRYRRGKERKKGRGKCIGCKVAIDSIHEYWYMVHNGVWSAAYGSSKERSGLSCIGCLERRLGRKLNRGDFDWSLPCNTMPFVRSKRLQKAMNRQIEISGSDIESMEKVLDDILEDIDNHISNL